MKKRIITDTMIWYILKQKEIDYIRSNYQIVIPITVLNELFTSPNISRGEENFQSLKTAYKNILNNKNDIFFIEENPFELLLLNENYKIPNKNIVNDYLFAFEKIIEIDYSLVKELPRMRHDVSSLNHYINSQSLIYKSEINKNLESKNRFNNLSTLQLTENLILKYANDCLKHTNKGYPTISKLSENQELMLNVFDELLRRISKTGQKMQNNDWVDIFNMIYVGKNDLYWTKEKTKKKIIERVGLSHYLFKIHIL